MVAAATGAFFAVCRVVDQRVIARNYRNAFSTQQWGPIMGELHLGSESYSTDGVNGKVGIGTNSPSEVLTVSDTTSLSVGNGKGNAGANEIQIKAPAAMLVGLDSKTNGNEFVRLATEQRRNWIQSFEATSGNPQSAALTLAAGTTRGIEIDNSGRVGISCSDPAGALDVSADRIRLRSQISSAPAGSGDLSGNVGDIGYDTLFLYIKTGSGWRRATLNTF
jgi:hypothetical protein